MPSPQQTAPCNTRRSDETCDQVAEFSVTAEGYPLPMYEGVCGEHLVVVLARDVSVGGSTARWIVAAL